VEVPHSLIVDLGLAGTRADVVSTALTLMQDSGEFDLIVFTIGSSARLNPELAVKSIAASAAHDVPVVAFTVPSAPAAAELLNNAGVATFRTPEACGDAIKAAFSRRPAAISARQPRDPAQTSQVLDEATSASILVNAGVPVAGSAAVDIGQLESAFPLPFEYPVVVKVLSEAISHKSDVGGVILNVASDQELIEAVRTIVENVRRHLPDIPVTQVLVQHMATRGLADALLGYRVSDDVGPMVVLSTGGVLAELFEDSSVRLAPVDLATAHEMIGEVRGLAPITGYRNLPLGDVDGLAQAIVAMSSMATTAPNVVEAEANPLQIKAKGDGVLALDALVRTA
jgi:acyl-CoA synthetase (NDP forming)